MVLYSLLGGSPERVYWAGLWCATTAPKLAGVHVLVEGRENIPSGVCVFVANHTSTADPPAVVGSIPRRVSLLVKKELFRVPIFGAAMRLAGFVPVDRSDSEAAIASVDRAIEFLRAGTSFVVYPEGTRSPDGRLRPFKKGSFVMAIRAGVPVVPISVAGAEKVMSKGRLRIYPGEIRIKFHPPIDASKYGIHNREELVTRVHAAVAAGLPEWQQPASGSLY